MIAALTVYGLFRRCWPASALGLLVLALGGLTGGLVWRQLEARWHLREAEAALARHDYEAASGHLAGCLTVWPNDHKTLLLAARTARRAENFPEAERLYEVLRTHNDRSPELALERTLLAVQMGQRPDIEPMLQQLVADRHAETPLILEALTRGYIATHRARAALGTVDALLRLQPNHAPAYVWRGWVREQFKNEEAAEADYRQAVALRPDYSWARLCLGVVLLNERRFQDALEQFQWLRAKRPNDPDIGLGLARSLRGVGDGDRARDLLDELIAAHPAEGTILSERGQLALEEGDDESAERWLRRALELRPFDLQVHYSLYRCLQQRGLTEEARQCLHKFEGLATASRRLKVLERELAKAGPDAARRYEAGLLAMRLGWEAQGERYLFAALRDDPKHREAHKALADHFEKRGRPDRAAFHRGAAR